MNFAVQLRLVSSKPSTRCLPESEQHVLLQATEQERALREFMCKLCSGVLKEPVSAPCGHHFCRPCLEKHFQVAVPGPLPGSQELSMSCWFVAHKTCCVGIGVQHSPSKVSALHMLTHMHEGNHLVLYRLVDPVCLTSLLLDYCDSRHRLTLYQQKRHFNKAHPDLCKCCRDKGTLLTEEPVPAGHSGCRK